MAAGTDTGQSPKWWEKLLATPAVLEFIDGGAASGQPAAMPVQETPPEPTRQDVQPYLLRVIQNPASQKVLIGTAVILVALGALAIFRRK